MTSLMGIVNWSCLLRNVLGGAGWMVLPVCGDAGGLFLQQEGDNDPAFLGVVLGLAAGRGYEGHGGRAWNEWEDIWFSYRIYSYIITSLYMTH